MKKKPVDIALVFGGEKGGAAKAKDKNEEVEEEDDDFGALMNEAFDRKFTDEQLAALKEAIHSCNGG